MSTSTRETSIAQAVYVCISIWPPASQETDFQCKEHAAQKLPGGMCKLVSLFNCAVYRLSASFCSICLRQAYTVSGVLLRFVYQPDNYVVEQLDFVIPDDGFEVRFADSGIVCEEHIISACHYR